MKSKYIQNKLFSRLEEKKRLLDKQRPLSKELILKLRDEFIVESTYNSNAIEGNTLTLKETRVVLEEGMTIAGKSLREHHEATSHSEAIVFLESLVGKKKLDEEDILKIHAIIFKDIEKEFSGRYRQGAVRILGASCIPPNYVKVPKLMKDLILWIKTNPEKLNPIELAAFAHYKFVEIHPFYDGNGRTARLLMNLILMQNGFPRTVVPVSERKKYFSALEKADKKNFAPFVNLMAQFVENAMDLYLGALGKIEQGLLPLSEIAPKTSYSSEYLSLLARKGELEATKRGKTWFSSLEAVKDYVKKRERKIRSHS